MNALGNDYGNFREIHKYTIGCYVGSVASATLRVPAINSSDNKYVLTYVYMRSAVESLCRTNAKLLPGSIQVPVMYVASAYTKGRERKSRKRFTER